MTPTATATYTAMPTATRCSRPFGWSIYTVQRNDTLFGISLDVGISLNELARVNCIEDVDDIEAGQQLFVPRLPENVSQSSAIGCTPAVAMITSPQSGDTVHGIVRLEGTAQLPDFSYYKVEIRPNTDGIYRFLFDERLPVAQGYLGQFDTSRFAGGLHWLRLSVVDSAAKIRPNATCEIPIIFD